MKLIEPFAHILDVSNQLKKVEYCGRICYKSEDTITEDSYIKFIKNIINRGHESVLEHGNYIFTCDDNIWKDVYEHYVNIPFEYYAYLGYSARLRFTTFQNRYIISGNIRAWRDFFRVCIDAYKGTENELIGYQLCELFFGEHIAFVDLYPQGYQIGSVNHKEHYKNQITNISELTPDEQKIHWTETAHFICSRAISHELVRHRALSVSQVSQRYVAYNKDKFGNEVTFITPLWTKQQPSAEYTFNDTMCIAEHRYLRLLNENMLQAQEARELLPNATKTELVMTGTIGEWIHFFNLRTSLAAHPEMRRIVIPLYEEFKKEGLL